jgi:hypothetical protein
MMASPAPRLRTLLLALALVALGPARLFGQSSGAVQMTGTVLQAITISGTDLRFGNMVATQTRTVAPSSASAGRFVLTMQPNAAVSIGYQLPSTLGPNVAIDGWSALYNTVNSTASATAISLPASSGTYVWSTPTGQMYVWLGAQLRTTNAAPGVYSAPVRLTVSYN